MSTKTLRPLKKGDPCWVRIQRRGKPVLAVYDEYLGEQMHAVIVSGKEMVAVYFPDDTYLHWECIFVAKPVREKIREMGQ